MIRDYLYHLRNVIYNYTANKPDFFYTLKANDMIIELLKNQPLHNKTAQNVINTKRSRNQSGGVVGGNDSFGEAIEQLTHVNLNLKQLVERIRIELEAGKTHNMHKQMKEIGAVSIEMLKFLGELIKLDQVNKQPFEKMQEQIVEMVEQLTDYLE
jgi:hypothetical protein